MRMFGFAVLGLILGFVGGEMIAILVGSLGGQLAAGGPPESILWLLRSLPFVGMIAGAVAGPAIARHSGNKVSGGRPGSSAPSST